MHVYTMSFSEDSFGTGDPHFMVTSQKTGERLCFDAHGKEDDVLKMIEDPTLGIKHYLDLYLRFYMVG